jgi:hypothetical protein
VTCHHASFDYLCLSLNYCENVYIEIRFDSFKLNKAARRRKRSDWKSETMPGLEAMLKHSSTKYRTNIIVSAKCINLFRIKFDPPPNPLPYPTPPHPNSLTGLPYEFQFARLYLKTNLLAKFLLAYNFFHTEAG